MPNDVDQQNAFWDRFILALEAAPQEANSIQGASGIQHSPKAVGLDRSRHRLIVVFGEEEASAAALKLADIQSAFRAIEVIGAYLTPSASHASVLETGLCPISLELIADGPDLSDLKSLLRRHHLLQYFFPAADHLALGLIESGKMRLLTQLIDRLVRTPDFGHPFGPTELMAAPSSFTEMVRELQNLGLVTEIDGGFQITDEGLKVRALVRDKPREALSFKILNRVSASLYLKSLLHPDLNSRPR